MLINTVSGRKPVTSIGRRRNTQVVIEAMEVRRLLSAAVWTGGAGDGQWNTAGNWQAGAVPLAGQDVQFPYITSSTTQVTLGSNVEVGNVEIDGRYLIMGSTMTLDGDIASNGSYFSQLVPTLLLTHNTTVTVGNSNELDIQPIIDGGNGYGLIKQGAGLLDIAGSGPDTFTGPSEVAAGTLNVVVSIPSVVTVDSGATLEGNAGFGGIVGNGGTIAALNGSSIGWPSSDGNVTLGTGGLVRATLDQFMPGSNMPSYLTAQGSSLDVTGASFAMNFLDGVTPSIGDIYTIISNQTGNPVVGTFANVPEGATTTVDGVIYQISYVGGSTHSDVTATVLGFASVWTGAGNDGLWSDSANWQTGSVPAPGANVIIENNINASPEVISVDMPVTVDSLTLQNVALTGDTITLAGTGNIIANRESVIVDPMTLDTDAIIETNNGFLALGGSIDDGGAGYGITFSSNSHGMIGPVSTAGGIPTFNTGVVSETYTGDTMVGSGAYLYYSADFAGNLVFAGGTGLGGGQAASLQVTSPNTSNEIGFSSWLDTVGNTLAVTNGLALSPGNFATFYVGGPDIGDGIDTQGASQIDVTGGTIDLNDSELTVVGSSDYVAQPSDIITLIHNQTGSPIVGTFSGLAEGASVTLGGVKFAISYRGGSDGQDVTLAPQLQADHLAVSQQPAGTVQVGQSLGSISIQLLNEFSNVATSDSSTIALSAFLSSGGSTSALTGITTIAANNGVATFAGLSFSQAGTYTITATDGTLASATTIVITVVSLSPSPAPVPSSPNVAVAGRRVVASVITNESSSTAISESAHWVKIRFENTSTNGKGSFTRTFRVNHGQVQVHNLRFRKAGSYNEIVYSRAGESVTPQFTVSAAAPKKMVFLAQPAGGTDSSAAVAVVDRFGNLSNADDGQTVTLGFPDGPRYHPHRTLTGSVAATIIGGVATFPNLTIHSTGASRLVATATGLQNVQSRTMKAA